jgi:hypothetical protein
MPPRRTPVKRIDVQDPVSQEPLTTATPNLPGVPKRRQQRILMPKPNQMAKAPRATAYEMQERRQKIYSLRLRGMPQSAIAKLLDVDINVVQRDLAQIQKENSAKIDQFQQNGFVGEAMSVYDDITHRAWSEYAAAPAGTPHRLKSLDLIRTTQNDKLKVLEETGMITKEPVTIEHKHTFELPWDSSIQDAVVNALIQQKLTPQLAEPTPDPHHEPGKNLPVLEAEVVETVETKPETDNGEEK